MYPYKKGMKKVSFIPIYRVTKELLAALDQQQEWEEKRTGVKSLPATNQDTVGSYRQYFIKIEQESCKKVHS